MIGKGRRACQTQLCLHGEREDSNYNTSPLPLQVKDLVVTLVSHQLLLMEQGHGFGL